MTGGCADGGGALRLLYVDTEDCWRGGQEQLLDLMAGLRSRGHEVWLAAPPGSPLQQKAAGAGIPTFPFRQRNELDFRSCLRLPGRPGAVDVVHSNTPRAVLAASWWARNWRIPLRVASRRVNFPLRGRLSVWKYRFCLDRIFTVSQSIRDTLVGAGLPPEMVEVIYEGIDLAAVEQAQTDFQLPKEKGPIIGIVAHLSEEKGHRDLLRAAARLRREGAQFLLVVVGEGPLRGQLEAEATSLQLRRHVLFTGFRSDCEALLKQMDIFCLPSLSEGLSSAIMAAMAARLPVVATAVGGIPELVVDGQTGRLVPAGHVEELARALGEVLADPERARAMGAAGRRRVERYFSLEAKLDATEAAYWNALARKRARSGEEPKEVSGER
ncbi:MAG: glycosyltransferase family 4 protein [Acidobacteriota bacterium]